MKTILIELIAQALKKLQQEQIIPKDIDLPAIQIERARDRQFGDFASNIAMMLAKPLKQAPRQIAENIKAHFPTHAAVVAISIDGPGFINFKLAAESVTQVIPTILNEREQYGHAKTPRAEKILLEYVSSNPTGPLHVGHGRQAVYGSCLANLLKAAGFDVFREYYVNDAGRQMAIVTVSVWLRYCELFGETLSFPSNAYQGDYIRAYALELKEQFTDRFFHPAASIFTAEIPADAKADGTGGDKEIHIDAVIARAQVLLKNDFKFIQQFALDKIVADMRAELIEFGVEFDQWFPESALVENGAVESALKSLRDRGYTYEKDGATWFKSTALGDEKDRVLIRSNGIYTYFTNDIAYHWHKLARGFNQLIDVFGADHHGHVPKLRAAIAALEGDPDKLIVALVQFVSLYRGQEKLAMSTRAGSFVTLRELREEVGNDAARFFYILRRHEQALDFDLALAKSRSNENPVYYIQYAHARISSVWRQLAEKQLSFDEQVGLQQLHFLNTPSETLLLSELARFPELITQAALQFEPQMLVQYLRDLANAFHSYYNAHQFLVDDPALRSARLCLARATQFVLSNGLSLLGISAPEKM